MDDLLLPVPASEQTDRRHQGSAVAAAISRSLAVDVQRVQAVGAMVSVSAADERCTDELATPVTPKCLVPLGTRLAFRASRIRTMVGRTALSATDAVIVRKIVSSQVVVVIVGNRVVRSQWGILRIRKGER